MGEPDYDEAQKVLEQANKELQIAFSAFNYYYVSHELWGKISGLIKNDKANQLQFVAQGTSVWSTAARAGKWLGDHGRRITRLVIYAHGAPGQFLLGQQITSENVAALGGWLSSFFEKDSVIQILSCNAAADSTQTIGKYKFGQANDPKWGGSISHRGYELLLELARASGQRVEGPLHGQAIDFLSLAMTCRRVFPDGRYELFVAGGIPDPKP
jgi:hypothetical protein